MAEGLTPRQQRFVDEYLTDLNATQAAIRAGYSAKTAEQGAAQLLRNMKVKAAVDAAMAQRAKDLGVTAERVVGRLKALSEKAEELEQISAAVKAEELLGKHAGMWPAKIEHTGKDGAPLVDAPAIVEGVVRALTEGKQTAGKKGALPKG